MTCVKWFDSILYLVSEELVVYWELLYVHIHTDESVTYLGVREHIRGDIHSMAFSFRIYTLISTVIYPFEAS